MNVITIYYSILFCALAAIITLVYAGSLFRTALRAKRAGDTLSASRHAIFGSVMTCGGLAMVAMCAALYHNV